MVRVMVDRHYRWANPRGSRREDGLVSWVRPGDATGCAIAAVDTRVAATPHPRPRGAASVFRQHQ
jgi:hypothetical protein